MSQKTSISWTDATWSPLRVGVRPDAAQIAEAKGYSSLDRPMRWRGAKRIFVENQSDLFGEWNADEQIDLIFAVMDLCYWHTFQILTKRHERMIAYLSAKDRTSRIETALILLAMAGIPIHNGPNTPWPMPHVWLGVSVENQETADERIPVLLKIPAAKRFVSFEPALGPVDFTKITHKIGEDSSTVESVLEGDDGFRLNAAREKLDWIIVGGESGTGARPFNIGWARNTISQCRESSIACFIKQLGKHPEEETELGTVRLGLRDRKGADMAEWPEDLRVQEFPS
jgi:protein gp37